MQTQTFCVCVRECVPATTGRSLLRSFFGLNISDVLGDFYLKRERDREGGSVAQILPGSGLTSKDVLTCSPCCCLLILLPPPVLLLTEAPCEWDVAAFKDDLYMCEINNFTQ